MANHKPPTITEPTHFRATLHKLGFDDYRQYLESKLWKQIQAKVLHKWLHTCAACAKHANHVHHNAFDEDTLTGKRLDALLPLCRNCYQATAKPGHTNTKVGPNTATQWINRHKPPTNKPRRKKRRQHTT